MVQAGVEFRQIFRPPSFGADAPQHLVPFAAGIGAHFVESHPPGFGLQVPAGVFNAGVRQAHLHLDRFIGSGFESQHQAVAHPLRFGRARLEEAVHEGAGGLGCFAQLSVKEHLHPLARIAKFGVFRISDDVAFNRLFAGKLDVSLGHVGAFALLMPDVKNQLGRIGCREGVAVEADPLGGGEFGFYAIVLQQHRVITRLGMLIGFVEARAVAAVGVFEGAGHGLDGAHRGHHHHAADLEFVEVPEAFDRSMAVVVAVRQPTADAHVSIRVRGQFGHAKWQGGRGVEKPPPVHRAKLWINVLDRIERGQGFPRLASC